MNSLLFALFIAAGLNAQQWKQFNQLAEKSDTQKLISFADSVVFQQPPRQREQLIRRFAFALIGKNKNELSELLIKHFRKKMHNPYMLSDILYIVYQREGKQEDAVYEFLNSRRKERSPSSYFVRRVKKFDMMLSPEKVDQIIMRWQRSHPETKLGYQLIAERLFERGEKDKAIEIADSFGIDRLSLAKIAFDNRDYEYALKLASTYGPQTVEAMYIIGISYLALGDTSMAIPYLRSVAKMGKIQAKKKLIEVAITLGDSVLDGIGVSSREMLPVWFCNGNCDRIVDLKFPKPVPEVYFYKGLCLLEMDTTRSGAFELFDSLLTVAPESSMVLTALRLRSYALMNDSLTFFRLFDVEKATICRRYIHALDSLDAILAQDTLSPSMRDNLKILKGTILLKMGRDSSAIKAFMEVTGQYRPMALWYAFRTALETGNMELAQRVYDELVTNYPKSPFAQMAIGMM